MGVGGVGKTAVRLGWKPVEVHSLSCHVMLPSSIRGLDVMVHTLRGPRDSRCAARAVPRAVTRSTLTAGKNTQRGMGAEQTAPHGCCQPRAWSTCG